MLADAGCVTYEYRLSCWQTQDVYQRVGIMAGAPTIPVTACLDTLDCFVKKL